MAKKMKPLDPNEKLDIEAILEDLEDYRPPRNCCSCTGIRH